MDDGRMIGYVGRQMDGWMDGWMDERMGESMDGWVDVQKKSLTPQYGVPDYAGQKKDRQTLG